MGRADNRRQAGANWLGVAPHRWWPWWQEECGQTTNCLLYDTDRLRRVLMLTTAAIMLIGVIFDIAVVHYAKDLKIFDTEEKEDESPPLQTTKTLYVN